MFKFLIEKMVLDYTTTEEPELIKRKEKELEDIKFTNERLQNQQVRTHLTMTQIT